MTFTHSSKQLAGRFVMIRITGTEVDAELANYLREYGIRAVCLFRQNMVNESQLRKLTADLRAIMGPDALIALDEEGGAVVRPTWVPQPPSAMSLGASDDVELCFEVGAATARAVKALGFNWNFAPVLDVNNNVNNPVIAERSFGSDPQRVIRLAEAWMRGSLSEGVACCIKHFPGHGDTHVDSHRALPTVNKSRQALEELEFAPFRALASQAPAVMTAHIIYPALDAEFPATMSRPILTDLLREQFGFRGVVITDGMDMHAIAHHYGAGNAAVMAFLAGADLVMALGNRQAQLETLEGIAAAMDSNAIDSDEIARRLQRIQILARAFPCVDVAYLTDLQDRALMVDAWQRGLSKYRQPQAPARGSKIRIIVRADVVSDGVSEAGISAEKIVEMLSSMYDVELLTFPQADQFDWASIPKDGRINILASTVRARYPATVRQTWQPDLHLVLWNPYLALDINAPALISYGFAAPAMQAVTAWLTGEIVATGVIPVDFSND